MKPNAIIMNLKALACQHLDLVPRETCKTLTDYHENRISELIGEKWKLEASNKEHQQRIDALEESIRAEVTARFGFSFSLEYTPSDGNNPWELRFAPDMKASGYSKGPSFYTAVFGELGITHEGCVAIAHFYHRPSESAIKEEYGKVQAKVAAFLRDFERANSFKVLAEVK